MIAIVVMIWIFVALGILRLRADIAKEAPTDSPRLYVILVMAFSWPLLFILAVVGLLIIGASEL